MILRRAAKLLIMGIFGVFAGWGILHAPSLLRGEFAALKTIEFYTYPTIAGIVAGALFPLWQRLGKLLSEREFLLLESLTYGVAISLLFLFAMLLFSGFGFRMTALKWVKLVVSGMLGGAVFFVVGEIMRYGYEE